MRPAGSFHAHDFEWEELAVTCRAQLAAAGNASAKNEDESDVASGAATVEEEVHTGDELGVLAQGYWDVYKPRNYLSKEFPDLLVSLLQVLMISISYHMSIAHSAFSTREMYDVDMDCYDDEDDGRDVDRKRTLSEHEAVVEHQLKRLKINHHHAMNSSNPPSMELHLANTHGDAPNTQHDVNYAHVNHLLREMHYLREMRRQQAVARRLY
ncbi:hypothetical protein DYB25_002694 [Aphanomyces astaci]|uniref:Uncharacterized protein n=1 Tax=Aphanomyces astaci TaxID=112090 RepID=A0A397BLY9_APHAT|nr:hypothetical protein DYB25_002694 [Aphanomyces astaci]